MTKLWLWKNFVDGRPEYWAFDNPFPVHLDGGDPQTLGEPCGYALAKESRNGRPEVTEAEVLRRIAASSPDKGAGAAISSPEGQKQDDEAVFAIGLGWLKEMPHLPIGTQLYLRPQGERQAIPETCVHGRLLAESCATCLRDYGRSPGTKETRLILEGAVPETLTANRLIARHGRHGLLCEGTTVRERALVAALKEAHQLLTASLPAASERTEP